jgi:hypothetical protein
MNLKKKDMTVRIRFIYPKQNCGGGLLCRKTPRFSTRNLLHNVSYNSPHENEFVKYFTSRECNKYQVQQPANSFQITVLQETEFPAVKHFLKIPSVLLS